MASAPFVPIARRRLVERLSALASYPIALLVAPAGYGKSVVLRQYLESVREPSVRFTLRFEHTSLLSFLRGFAEALGEHAPHAIGTLAGAYERNQGSSQRGADLARWMHAHLESFSGIIAVDDLHVADEDPEVARFLTSLVERSKDRVRWIVASRSITGLPVGTWLAYRDADLPIDEHELRFTLEEAKAAARDLSLSIRDQELSDLLDLTEGWPAAISFALRTSTRSSDLRSVSAVTREMIYRFLAEQVYAALSDEQRGLLEVAMALPIIDVRVLERAGFDRALQIVEQLCERTAFVYEESPGIYQCHDLFREFFRHQNALGGKRSQEQLQARAARALEASGDIEHAIAAYAAARARDDVLRLIEQHGFDLLERARSDVVSRAIEALDETTKRENATVLALQGALQATAGKFARAESLLRRSLTRAGGNRDLMATASLRLAAMLGNQGSDVAPLLGPIFDDAGYCAAHRAEAVSLIAARRAIAGQTQTAAGLISSIVELLPQIESDATRAKVLHHLGIVNRHVGSVGRSFEALHQSSNLAAELHLFGLASRVNAVLSNLALHEEDDIDRQAAYAELAATAATKAGDAFALHTALLQLLSAATRRGDLEKSMAVEERLFATTLDELTRRYVTFFRATRLGWEGRFGEAHRLMAGCWDQMHFDFDRVSSGAQYALYLALDEHRDLSVKGVQDVLRAADSFKGTSLFGVRSVAVSRAYCALAEIANHRSTAGLRILRTLDQSDPVAKAAWESVRSIYAGVCGLGVDAAEMGLSFDNLNSLGYSDAAQLLRAAGQHLTHRRTEGQEMANLTPAELAVLRLLADGFAAKEIAQETGRSVHTVRVHIANVIWKLECHGQLEAVERARRRGIV